MGSRKTSSDYVLSIGNGIAKVKENGVRAAWPNLIKSALYTDRGIGATEIVVGSRFGLRPVVKINVPRYRCLDVLYYTGILTLCMLQAEDGRYMITNECTCGGDAREIVRFKARLKEHSGVPTHLRRDHTRGGRGRRCSIGSGSDSCAFRSTHPSPSPARE
jgi:hypothetical protein